MNSSLSITHQYNKLYRFIYSTLLGPKYTIDDFKKEFIIVDGNNYEKSQLPFGYNYKFYYNNKCVGLINFRENGQIGILRLDDEYRGWGIGSEMLELTKEFVDTDKRWCVTFEDHPFWKSMKNAVWKEPAHWSVTGNGYEFEL